MNRPRNFRIFVLLAAILIAGVTELLREHRPSFLRPGLRLCAYVTLADGSVAVIDLIKLAAVAHITVGPGLSGIREHPKRPEIWGVSSSGGFVWVLDPRTNQIETRIPVGARPYAVDFSPDGRRAYTTSAGTDTLIAIDCQTHAILAQTKTGAEPVLARATPDGKSVVVVNRRAASLEIFDAMTLAVRAAVPVISQPEDVALLPDSTVAFVLSREEKRLSVVDLARGVLLTDLELAGRPSEMLLKPDGGELYVLSPEVHGLQVINTWTHEIGDYLLLGSAPTRGILTADGSQLYVSDTAAGRVTTVDILNRRMIRGPSGEVVSISVGQSPSALRFDPQENLLLVVDESSGDLAVIRVRTNSLLTLIPLGNEPQDLAVKLF
jgi:DNA-binding beta-propeller fold protein YncE